MASCEATNPSGMCCVPPVSVVTSVPVPHDWTTPPATSTSAETKAIGRSTRPVPRTTSTQTLPSVSDFRRASPRTRATATDSPTAADRKFCTARPAICTVYPTVTSGEYDCQFVFATNEAAVLNASEGPTAGRPRSPGSTTWMRWSR